MYPPVVILPGGKYPGKEWSTSKIERNDIDVSPSRRVSLSPPEMMDPNISMLRFISSRWRDPIISEVKRDPLFSTRYVNSCICIEMYLFRVASSYHLLSRKIDISACIQMCLFKMGWGPYHLCWREEYYREKSIWQRPINS